MRTTLALAKPDQEELQEFVRMITDRYEETLDEIILFGSGARGSLSKDSDLDVLVILKRRSLTVSREITRFATDMLLRYGRYLSVKTMSSRMYQQLQALETPFMLYLARHGKVLWRKS